MINVIGEPDLVRDPYSKALLNTNTAALQEHRKRKQQARAAVARVDALETDVASLKESMTKIEAMLQYLVSQSKDSKWQI